jgi:alanyl-tRNA synthetase
MKKEEISKVEEIVNSKILENLCVSSKEMTMDNAIKEGALALFGEKYGEEVRVIKMDKFSTELCGGTHVTNTSEIGLFSIVSEASLSTGVRRIEALTSLEAIQRLNKRSNILSEIENTVKDKELKTISKVQNILTELKVKQKEIDQLKDQIESKNSVELFNGPEEIAKGVLFKSVEAPNGSDIRKLSDIFINKNPTGVLLIYTDINDKRSILLKCNKSNKKIHCSNILKESLPIIAGKGGGKPDMAQGSSDKVDMNDFIGSIKEKIINSIN